MRLVASLQPQDAISISGPAWWVKGFRAAIVAHIGSLTRNSICYEVAKNGGKKSAKEGGPDVPVVTQQLVNPTSIHKDTGSITGLA